MLIELQNINYSEIRDGNGVRFSADLFIDGVKAGRAANHGATGSPTTIHPLDNATEGLIVAATAFCSTMHSLRRTYDTPGGKKRMTIKMSLPAYVECLVEDHVFEKERQRARDLFEHNMKTAILYGESGKEKGYTVYDFKIPLAEMLASPAKTGVLRAVLDDVILPSLKAEEKILNTNISRQELLTLGVPPERIGRTLFKRGQQKKARIVSDTISKKEGGGRHL